MGTMQYNQGDYMVQIKRTWPYTRLTIFRRAAEPPIHCRKHLPICDSKIEAEDNAKRIADQWIEWNEKQPTLEGGR